MATNAWSRLRRRAWPLVAVLAVALGIGAAAGPVTSGRGTDATLVEAIPRLVVGAVVGVAVAGAALWAIVRWFPRRWNGRDDALVVVPAVAFALCVLLAVSTTPRHPEVELQPVAPTDADTRGGAHRYEGSEDAAVTGRAGPVDLDGDGVGDTLLGAPLFGFDSDGDLVADGLLRACSSVPDPDLTVPSDRKAIDADCNSTVDELIPFDPTSVLTTDGTLVTPDEPPAGNDAAMGWLSTLALVAALAGLVVTIVFLRATRLAPVRDHQLLLVVRDPLVVPDDVDLEAVTASLESSLDEMLRSPDPRVAIRAAYGTLLAGLADVGLGRRPEEAPAEHLARCLRAAELPAGAMRELLELFALARFSAHAITEHHRQRALTALRDSIAHLHRALVPA